jgi:hypothetical protein
MVEGTYSDHFDECDAGGALVRDEDVKGPAILGDKDSGGAVIIHRCLPGTGRVVRHTPGAAVGCRQVFGCSQRDEIRQGPRR